LQLSKKGTLMPGSTKKAAAKKASPKAQGHKTAESKGPEAKDTTLSATASSAGVSSDGPVEKASNTPTHQEGPESLVAKGIREHEAQVADLRKGNDAYPKVDVSVSYPGGPAAPVPDTKVEDVDFVHVHHLDEQRKLPGTAPYLDDVNRQNEEVQRAKVEGREPDLANPPSTQGTPLRPVASVGVPVPEGAAVVTLPVVREK
jgi:hypothetical protein